MQQWKNYGDVNFWDYGVLVRRHREDKEDEYDILYKQDAPDRDKVTVALCYVDINDSWINRESVMSYSGENNLTSEEDKIKFAIDCIGYYGIHEFQPSFPTFQSYGGGGTVHDWQCTPEEAYEWLQGFEVGDLVENPVKESVADVRHVL